VGACVGESGEQGVRWLSLIQRGHGVRVAVFETADQGSPTFLDLYEFAPLDPALALGEATKELTFDDLSSCLVALAASFPGIPLRFVNEGVIQDEYADFLARKSQSDPI
jgi:hypothetical protein